MSNYITENKKSISTRHYVRKANASHYWFDFKYNKLQSYQKKFGEQFCLILYRSGPENDAYIIPFSLIKHLLTTGSLIDQSRWMGSISDGYIHIRKSNQSISAKTFYNNFKLLDIENNIEGNTIKDEIQLNNLSNKIKILNEKFKNAVPIKKTKISEEIDRPSTITDYLKKYQNYKCQICKSIGFTKKMDLSILKLII